MPKFETITIAPSSHKRFVSGYPWLYNNEILPNNQTKSMVPGQLVQVLLHGNPLATGYFNKHSLISFRVLSRNPEEPIDTQFFKNRLQEALHLRERFFNKPFYRLIHAEGDLLPGLIIDRFDSVFVLQINTQGMEKLKDFIISALQELFNPTTLYIKRESAIRKMEGLSIEPPEIIGNPIQTLTVEENDVTFKIDISEGQKTGWFYDHRENRKIIANLAKDNTILDYYCYSGGFSLQAATKGAKKVIGVDRSSYALQNAKESATLNQVDSKCEFIESDVFEDMDKRLNNLERFDIVVLDPPAFVKTKKDLPTGLKGYEKLITKGLQLTEKDGLLLIASCSYHVKELDLKNLLSRALYKTNRVGKIVQRLSAGCDHPVHPALEESEYLKGLLVSV